MKLSYCFRTLVSAIKELIKLLIVERFVGVGISFNEVGISFNGVGIIFDGSFTG